MIQSWPNWLKREENSSRRSFMNFFKKHRRKRSYHTSRNNGIICPIHMKGNVMMCDNYRAVTLLCITYKILANILYVNLGPYAEEILGKYQGVFQRRSTVDQIFTMRHLLEKCLEHNFMCVYIYRHTHIIYLLIFKQHMALYEERKYGVKCIN